MVLDRLYTVAGISSFSWLSGKQFMISFSYKMELRWINSSPLLSKWIDIINFGGFFIYLSDFLYIFDKTISVIRSTIFFGKCSVVNFELDDLIMLALLP